MESKQKKIYIIGASCFAHLLALLFFLVWYQSPNHDALFSSTIDQTAINTPETVFYDEPPQSQTAMPEDKGWAQLKPRVSSLGDSMEMPETLRYTHFEHSRQTIRVRSW